MAFARSAGSRNSETIIAMITDDETAPPRPWMKRAAIRIVLVARQPAQDRRQGEDRHAAQENALAPDQVAEAAGQQEEAAERDQVGVDDPGQVGLADAEVASGSPGRATFTTEPSSVFISIARHTTPSAIQRRRCAGRGPLRVRSRSWVWT